jgi:soluble lytic murein transglycosylase
MKKIVVFVIVFVLITTLIGSVFFVFPVKYKEIILKYSSRFDIDGYIVASVINIESGYDKSAKSTAGAIGLMQLLPSTAEEIAVKLNKDFSENDLCNPETNIEFGCYYLSYLFDYFNGNIINVLSAYNWGLNNVRNWIKEGNVDENGNITLKRTQEINRDSFIKYMLYCRTLISNYTNLDIETENFYEEYDLLKSSGLLDLIMSSFIPETEIAEFKIILKMKQEDLIFNNNSTHNYVSNQIGRIENLVSTVVNPTIESITSYLNNLDEKDSKRLVSRIDKILGKLDRLVKSSK